MFGNEQRKGKLLGMGLVCLALLLGWGARPAPAQTTAQTAARSRAEVRRLLNRLRLKADVLSGRIQATSQRLSQLQLITTPNLLTQLMIDRLASQISGSQSELATVQQSITVVSQLNADLGAASRLTLRIKSETRLLAQLQSSGARTRPHLARISSLQNAIQADEAALLALEQQIATLQQKVAQLFG